MKNSKLFLIGLAATLLMCGCSKSSENDNGNGGGSDKGSVVGQWHLVSWSTLKSADVYVAFTEEGSFELYQRLYTPGYVHLNGTYSYNRQMLEGLYGDNQPWAGSYRVTFDTNGTRMTLTRVESANDVSVFVKADIPDEIISGELENVSPQSRTDRDTPRFL